MEIKAFFDSQTSTLTYVVWSEGDKKAVVIDPVLDYDQASSSFEYNSIDKLMTFVADQGLEVKLILETHVHADHLTGAQELKKRLPGAKIGIGQHIVRVQSLFKKVFNFAEDFISDGSQFDVQMIEGQSLSAGRLDIEVLHTPGHTPACCSYLINGKLFTGDALFMPDFGVARCDFPGGDAEELYKSVTEKLYSFPDETEYYTGHDYQPGGRDLMYKSTIGDSKNNNIHINTKTKKEEFIKFRQQRDRGLSEPRLLYPSVHININAGHLPRPESNGQYYLKIPIQKKSK